MASAVARPVRRCRWCYRILTTTAKPDDERLEKPHCPSPTCDWGAACHQKRVPPQVPQP